MKTIFSSFFFLAQYRDINMNLLINCKKKNRRTYSYLYFGYDLSSCRLLIYSNKIQKKKRKRKKLLSNYNVFYGQI